MRRKDKALQDKAVTQILLDGEYGVLSTVDGDGQPYGVPLNYVYQDNCIYFHCALVGRKLDNIALNGKVSFCVVGRTEVLPAEFSTGFESVVAFGTAEAIHGEEGYKALLGLLEKYCADYMESGRAYIEKLEKQTRVVRIRIEQVTGKAKITGNM